MKKNKIVIILIGGSFAMQLFAGIATIKDHPTHFRLSLHVSREEAWIKREDNKVVIKTNGLGIKQKISEALAKVKFPNKYFSNDHITVGAQDIILPLKDSSIEIFDFYKSRDKNLVLDFWTDSIANSEIEKVEQKTSALHRSKMAISEQKVISQKKLEKVDDFSHGATITWNYPALSPDEEQNTKLPTSPEEFFPLLDRPLIQDEKEKHLQISLNFYRAAKWSELYRSLTLYSRRYGKDHHFALNEFMKLNALLKQNVGKEDVLKSVLYRLGELAQLTEDFELKKASFHFSIEHYQRLGQYSSALEDAKKYYQAAQKALQVDEAEYALSALAKILTKAKEWEKLLKFLGQEAVQKQLPQQNFLSYQFYALMNLKKPQAVIDLYEKSKNELYPQIHSSILFNVAEAYFEKKDWNKSLPLFENFLELYSQSQYRDHAKLRKVLCQDLLGYSAQDLLASYQEIFSNTSIFSLGYEARLRYVGLSVLRQAINSEMNVNELLAINPEFKKDLDLSLKKLLWQVRLRLLLKAGQYNQAISYSFAIPWNTLLPEEQELFSSDMGELVAENIFQVINQEDWKKALSLWETFSKKYSSVMGNNPFIYQVIALAYGIQDQPKKKEQVLKLLKDLDLTGYHPEKYLWQTESRRLATTNKEALIYEVQVLESLKKKDMINFAREIDSLRNIDMKYPRINYYQSLLYYQEKKYVQAEKLLKEILINPQQYFSLFEQQEVAQKYAQVLYQQNKMSEFAKVASNLCLFGPKKTPKDSGILEELHYLLIESYVSSQKDSNEELEKIILKFKENFSNSRYNDRVTYLQAVNWLGRGKNKEAIQTLTELIGKEDVPDPIKELAKSELATIKIKGL